MTAVQHDGFLVSGIRARLTRPLVLIGLMGSGKTRLGRLLAETLDLPFADSDEEIEQAAGMSVAEIFDRFGEPYFREGECRVVRRLLEGPPQVIATGGGAVMTPETAELIWQKGVSIWVRAELPVMLERTGRNNKRPLLAGDDPEAVLRDLMDRRYPIYARADIEVESRAGPAEWSLGQALAQLDDFLRGRTS